MTDSSTRDRYSRRRLLLAGLAFAAVSALGCGEACTCEGPQPEPEPVVVYIVRHAEKQLAPEAGGAGEAGEGEAGEMMRRDPPLSREGQIRALGLPQDIPAQDIDAIFVTRTQRSEQTASAVTALTGLEPIHYPPKDYPGIVKRLRKRHGQKVLLVGHSNTIPPLLKALGVKDKVTIGDQQYGDLWVVTLLPEGRAELETQRFGERVEHRPGPTK